MFLEVGWQQQSDDTSTGTAVQKASNFRVEVGEATTDIGSCKNVVSNEIKMRYIITACQAQSLIR
jgi:hypothetical protein